MPKTLREKASKKLQGPDANPNQLGDPISLKAETSDNIGTGDEKGAQSALASSPSKSHSTSNEGGSKKSGDREGETLREKATRELNGPDANPTQLGDPTSLKSETSPGVPVEREQGVREEEVVVRDSKL